MYLALYLPADLRHLVGDVLLVLDAHEVADEHEVALLEELAGGVAARRQRLDEELEAAVAAADALDLASGGEDEHVRRLLGELAQALVRVLLHPVDHLDALSERNN